MKFKNDIELQAGLEDLSGSTGTSGQLLSSTATGTAWIDPSAIPSAAATLVVIACKNTSGAAIAQGTPVYQTGTVGATATIEIAPADALISANKLPAIGLLQTDLNNNGFGNVVITGELTNFTTSPIDGVVPTTGDKIFVKSGGGLTLTKPTGEGNGIQNMGLVGKVASGNSGSITVSSIMRTNDVPNLPEGRIWVGDGNTIVSDTVYVDEPNNRVGIGTISPLNPLSIENSSSPLIKIRNTTNGGGAAIEFNDNAASTTNQNGRITYYHSDGASQGGGSSYWLTGQDDQTLVLANNGRVVVQKSGSASEVGYGFYDDVNTGMYRVSADALGFSTGGTRRLDMNSSGVRIGTGSRVSTILDQDNMSSNSNTALATQQSIKAYVDNSVAAIITPAAPSTVTSTIVGETIEIAFNQSTTSDIDYYQVWSSDDGGDYGIIGQITSDDFSATMTVVDTTFVTGGTMSYRVYAVRQGVYSSAATTSKSYTVSALSVTNMTVVNLNTAYYIQYEKPNSRFIDHIEIWMDSQTTQAALNRTNATLVYSGQNHSYMRNVNTSNNFHQFWVEIVTS